MLALINWRLKVTLNDGRALVGHMLAFDRHMNLVLSDCEEFRRVRPKKKPGESADAPAPEQEIKRTLGLVILRGETVVSLSVEGPPPVQDEDKKNAVRTHPTPPSPLCSRARRCSPGPDAACPRGAVSALQVRHVPVLAISLTTSAQAWSRPRSQGGRCPTAADPRPAWAGPRQASARRARLASLARRRSVRRRASAARPPASSRWRRGVVFSKRRGVRVWVGRASCMSSCSLACYVFEPALRETRASRCASRPWPVAHRQFPVAARVAAKLRRPSGLPGG